jgi:hypothetical protein
LFCKGFGVAWPLSSLPAVFFRWAYKIKEDSRFPVVDNMIALYHHNPGQPAAGGVTGSRD